jgi:hypothetical protein
MTTDEISGREWWAARRLRYNIALVVAGIAAFATYAAVLGTRCASDPDAEITAFTIAFQSFGYMLAMAVANVAFNLGRWSETLVRPVNIAGYRTWTWRLGLGFSVALPFTIPALVAISHCRGGR